MGCGAPASSGPYSSTGSGQSGLRPADLVFLQFYRGSGKDFAGRTLDEIWSWDHKTLERRHDYIQVLFPTDQSSQYNDLAPDFPPELQAIFRNDSQVMANFAKSFDVFCSFLGFHYDADRRCIERTPDFEQRAANWLSWTVLSPNHNWLRCSRVLHCMRLLGDIARRDALYDALEQVYAEGLISSRFEQTVKYWQQYGGIEDRPIPIQATSPRSPSSPRSPARRRRARNR